MLITTLYISTLDSYNATSIVEDTMVNTSFSLRWLFMVVSVIALGITVSEATTDDDVATTHRITIVGLGSMGRSVLKCLVSKGDNIEVHAWNRGASNRQLVLDMELDGVTVHDNVTKAIAASDNIVLVVINSGKPNLDIVHKLVHESKSALEGKTLINFVNHEPFAAQDLDQLLEDINVHHVAGSMFATPENICTPGALILTSAPPVRSTKAVYRGEDHTVTPILSMLGRHEVFEGNVGYGSLWSQYHSFKKHFTLV